MILETGGPTELVLERLSQMFQRNPFDIGSNNENFLEFCDEFIFCFNQGNLVRRIMLLQSELTVEEVLEKLVSFYSFKMFLIHYHFLQKQNEAQSRLKKLFLESHKYKDLAQFLNVTSTALINSNIKEGMREDEDEKAADIKRSVVLTTSDEKAPLKRAREFLVSDYEDKGSMALKHEFCEALENDDISILLVHFSKPQNLKHFRFLKRQVDNWVSEKNQPEANLENKHICFLVFQGINSKSKFTDLWNGDHWKCVVIENLRGSSYAKDVEYVDLSTLEINQKIFRKIEQKDQTAFLGKIFLRAFSKLNFKQYLGTFVKDFCLPKLRNFSFSRDSTSSFFFRFLKQFFSELETSPDFQDLPDWRHSIFESKEVDPIETLVQNIFANLMNSHLKDHLILMKKFNVLGNLSNLDQLTKKDNLQERIEKLFMMQLKSKKNELR